MIKGSLLVTEHPHYKAVSGRKFCPKTRTFGSVFRTPWKNPWTNIYETYGHILPSQALRPAVFGAKQCSAVFVYSLNKKEKKQTQNRTAFRTGIRRNGRL